MRLALGLWRRRWGLVRLGLAVLLAWALAVDTPARLARIELSSLPDADLAGEVASLRLQGRYGEAVMVADQALAREGESRATPEQAAALAREREATIVEQQSWWRRAKDAGMGALSGRGDSLEGLLGAVAADFFVVGDIRDLLIQGTKFALDGEADEVVLALSAVGLATTLAPEIDWAPAILKAARKAGTLSKRFAASLVALAQGGKRAELARVGEDVVRMGRKASPGGAMRMLRHAENPEELSALARFVEREPGGALALHATGEEGAKLVKRAAKEADEVARASAEGLVVKAARKGEAGKRFLSSKAARALLSPHPLVGIAKGLWKGNAAKLVQRLVDRLGADAWWLLPLAAAWAFVEVVLLARRGRSATDDGEGPDHHRTRRAGA